MEMWRAREIAEMRYRKIWKSDGRYVGASG